MPESFALRERVKVLERRYLARDAEGRLIETPDADVRAGGGGCRARADLPYRGEEGVERVAGRRSSR